MRDDFVPKPPPLLPVPKSGWPYGVTRESSEAIDLYARHMTNIHLARPAATQESASSALFLAAPASFYNTGHVLPIDGGWKCWLREGLLT